MVDSGVCSQLKGGLLWSPDSSRLVSKARRRLGRNNEVCERRAESRRAHRGFRLQAGARGAGFLVRLVCTDERTDQGGIPWFTSLTGPQGIRQTAHVRRLFAELAEQFLAPSAGPQPAAPTLARLDDFSPWSNSSARDTEQLLADFRLIASGLAIPERLRESKFAFLMALGTLSRTARSEALGCLEQVIESFPGSSCLLAYDETQQAAGRFSNAQGPGRSADELAGGTSLPWENNPKLLRRICADSRLDNLATAAWLLGQMREQARVRGVDRALRSRADVLAGCVSACWGNSTTQEFP